jgi:hypothetical protein
MRLIVRFLALFLAIHICFPAGAPAQDDIEEAFDPSAGDDVETDEDMPEIQKKFVKLVCDAQDADLEAMNDLKKFDIKKKLEANLKKLLKKSKKIDRWSASLGIMEIDRKGRVAVIFEMPLISSNCNIMLGNQEAGISLSPRYFTIIKHGSKLFKQLSQMEFGDKLKLSGQFVTDNRGAPRHDGLDAFYIRITAISR